MTTENRQDTDGAVYLAYYRADKHLHFTWNGTQGGVADISYGGAGEPVFARVGLGGNLLGKSLIEAMQTLKRRADEVADGFSYEWWAATIDRVTAASPVPTMRTYELPTATPGTTDWDEACDEAERHLPGCSHRPTATTGLPTAVPGRADCHDGAAVPGLADLERDRYSEARAGGNIFRKSFWLFEHDFEELAKVPRWTRQFRADREFDLRPMGLAPNPEWPIMKVGAAISEEVDQAARFE